MGCLSWFQAGLFLPRAQGRLRSLSPTPLTTKGVCEPLDPQVHSPGNALLSTPGSASRAWKAKSHPGCGCKLGSGWKENRASCGKRGSLPCPAICQSDTSQTWTQAQVYTDRPLFKHRLDGEFHQGLAGRQGRECSLGFHGLPVGWDPARGVGASLD